VDARRPTPVATRDVRVSAPADVLTVELPLPALSPGVYRLTMEAARGDGDPLVETRRTFVVRRTGFPRLEGIEALIGPLAYIASPGEMRRLQEQAALGADSARAAFDAFWGGLFRDRRRAVATLRAYYERVEEANRQFSAHLDGWKTDRGMVYILFGPPERVEDRFESEVWTYGSGQGGAVFVFERTARREDGRSPFDVWTLTRDRAYDATWRRALRLWRSGNPP
jgi:GWxTD domain-containing protein